MRIPIDKATFCFWDNGMEVFEVAIPGGLFFIKFKGKYCGQLAYIFVKIGTIPQNIVTNCENCLCLSLEMGIMWKTDLCNAMTQ